ncbi:hypothetical protein JW979_15275 [bacterium]|nr:hypothetical protein [candidate division CSSED10-310 bacterium]
MKLLKMFLAGMSVLLIAIPLLAHGTLNEPPGRVLHYTYGWNWCIEANDSDRLAEYPPHPDEYCEMTVEGYNLYVAHFNTAFNCCLDKITVTVSVEPGIIQIIEEEFATNPCYCYCYYDVFTYLYNLEPGVYDVEVYGRTFGGETELRCTDQITITGDMRLLP